MKQSVSNPRVFPRLPNEILCTIFHLFVFGASNRLGDDTRGEDSSSYSVDYCTWPDVFDLNNGPWLLGRVCSNWRSMALSLPAIWQCFQLRPFRRSFTKDIMSTWLHRCGRSESLSFRLSFADMDNRDISRSALDIVMLESHRWNTLEVFNPCFEFWRTLNLYHVGDRLHSLERLVLLSDQDDEESLFDPNLYHIFQNAPKLHSVINNSHFTLIEASLPWAQLTEYRGLDLVPPQDHFHILHLSKNIERCYLVFQIYLITAHDLSLGTPMVLPNLTRLTTRWFFYDDGLSAMLHSLRLPALKHLSFLGGHHHWFDREFTDLAFVLQSSGCQLETLELSGLVENTNGLSEVLASVPAVTDLCLWVNPTSSAVHEVVISLLHIHGEGRLLLPKLNCLEFRILEPGDFHSVDLIALAKILRWRWSHLPPDSYIQRFCITLCMEYVEKGEKRSLPPLLETLQEEGLEVVVRSIAAGKGRY